MTNKTDMPATKATNAEKNSREALAAKATEMAQGGIRLSADKAWLRPAIEAAVKTKVDGAVAKLTDDETEVVYSFLTSAL